MSDGGAKFLKTSARAASVLERKMGLILVICLGLLVWTALSVLWLVYQIVSVFNLGGSRKDNWFTYLIAAPVVAILFVARRFKRDRQ